MEAALMMSRVTVDTINRTMVKLANVNIRKAKESNHLQLARHISDKDSSRLFVFSDSSIPNNDDLATQIGLNLLMIDPTLRAN